MADLQVGGSNFLGAVGFIAEILLQNGNRKVMQAVVQRKFRANQFESDPEKIEKYKGE